MKRRVTRYVQKEIQLIGYLILAIGIVVGLWASHHNSTVIQGHLNSHEERDQRAYTQLTLKVCKEQNKVKKKVHLPPTNCNVRRR